MGFPPKFAVLLMGFLILCSLVRSVPNTTVISSLCNVDVYTHGDPFRVSLTYVLDDLETGTPTSKNYDYHNISPYPNAFAYGHATCDRNLSGSDCNTCVGSAKSRVLAHCQSRIGGRATLQDCKIRYEQYPFTE
uniref:Gnk2-homologous domain-containing protein n=1 Tax=Rhizophora mucronata TaxID=61149 RepID=A0A2P2QWA2_RHIMU